MSPKKNKTNRYNELFSNHLCDLGINVIDFDWRVDLFGFKNILRMRAKDIIHIHWPSTIYQHENLVKNMIKIFLLFIQLFILKIKKVDIVWTIHNIYPHEYKNKKIEKFVRQIIIDNCRIIFSLGEGIKRSILNEYKLTENKIKVIKHGHYFGEYPENYFYSRESLNIKQDDVVFLFIGQIKAYKGIEELIDSFTKAEIENSKLIIAGNPTKEMNSYIKEINHESIIKITQFIPDDDLVSLIGVCDYVVLPYKNITTSGTAILAASYNKPIILPDNECIRDYFNEEIAIFFKNNTEKSLVNALHEACENIGDFKQSKFEEFRKELDWNKIAEEVVECYKK